MGDPGVSEAAQRAARRIRIKIHDFDAGTGVCGMLNKSNREFLDRTSAEDAKIIIEEMSLAASAEVSELREALRNLLDEDTECEGQSNGTVASVVRRTNPDLVNEAEAILKKHGDGI